MRIFIRVVFGFYRERATRAGLRDARTGSVTVVQRFGGALNLNVHLHTLTPEGVWAEDPAGQLIFHPQRPPTDDDLEQLGELVEHRVHRLLVRRGLWEDDEDGGRPADAIEEPPPLADLYQASIAQRAAGGERRGRHLRRVGVTMALETAQVGVSVDRTS